MKAIDDDELMRRIKELLGSNPEHIPVATLAIVQARLMQVTMSLLVSGVMAQLARFEEQLKKKSEGGQSLDSSDRDRNRDGG